LNCVNALLRRADDTAISKDEEFSTHPLATKRFSSSHMQQMYFHVTRKNGANAGKMMSPSIPQMLKYFFAEAFLLFVVAELSSNAANYNETRKSEGGGSVGSSKHPSQSKSCPSARGRI